MEGRFGEAGFVSAYERGNGTQVVVTMLVVHVVAGKEERFAAPKTTGQGRSRGPGSLEVLHTRAGEMEPATGPLIIPHRVGGGYTRPYTVFRRRVGLG